MWKQIQWVVLVLALLGVMPATAQDSGRSAKLAYEQNTIDVFRGAAPATVFITQTRVMRDRWTMTTQEYESGSGSGFVWDAKGHIVTNYHVIADGNAFEVTFQGGVRVPATFVGGDPNKDIAVLKVSEVPAVHSAGFRCLGRDIDWKWGKRRSPLAIHLVLDKR